MPSFLRLIIFSGIVVRNAPVRGSDIAVVIGGLGSKRLGHLVWVLTVYCRSFSHGNEKIGKWKRVMVN